MRTFYRPVEERDIRMMKRGKGTLCRNLLRATLPFALFLSALAYLIWRSWVVAVGVGLAAFGISGWSNISFFRNVRGRQNSGASDAVVVTEVQAVRVLEIEPLGSRGPAFVCFTTDGKALLLVGQWLLDYKGFPSISFRLRQWADTKKPICIEITGARIEPEQSAVQLKPGYRLTDVEAFEAAPETLQQDLDRSFYKNPSQGDNKSNSNS